MRYCMQYLKTENIHLVKDMGMIPYKLHKLYNYDSTVATYNYGEFSYLKDEVKGLKLDFVRKVFNNYSLDGIVHLIKRAEDIDILQLFHCTLSSVAYAYVYKLFNPKGKIYLKLDCSHKLVERIEQLNKPGRYLLNRFLDKIDLISIEQEELYIKLRDMLQRQRDKIINLPNGIDYELLDRLNIRYDYNIKEDTILNVARIGAEEKNTMLLLEAFAGVRDIEKSTWKLKLAGKIEQGFEKRIDEYFSKYPYLKDKVIFMGQIEDRKMLFEEYARAKIFSLTSDFESFGIAFIEAAALGNIIVSTDVGIARELIREGNGKLVAPGDVGALTVALEHFMTAANLEELSSTTEEICRNKFDWDRIIEKLHCCLQNIV